MSYNPARGTGALALRPRNYTARSARELALCRTKIKRPLLELRYRTKLPALFKRAGERVLSRGGFSRFIVVIVLSARAGHAERDDVIVFNGGESVI